jgi:hypothetical protein
MRTVELLPDPELEHRVRRLWSGLSEAGFPSLADHRHPTNRPHLTVLTAGSIDALPALPLPVPVQLGAVRFLGRALVWAVLPDARLREIHATAWSALAGAGPWPTPADWVPHISLALKVPADRRPAMLEAASGVPPAHGFLQAARSYDTVTRAVTPLSQ